MNEYTINFIRNGNCLKRLKFVLKEKEKEKKIY